MSDKKKKPSLWEQMGRKTGSSKSKEKQKDEAKKKLKVKANIRGTKIY